MDRPHACDRGHCPCVMDTAGLSVASGRTVVGDDNYRRRQSDTRVARASGPDRTGLSGCRQYAGHHLLSARRRSDRIGAGVGWGPRLRGVCATAGLGHVAPGRRNARMGSRDAHFRRVQHHVANCRCGQSTVFRPTQPRSRKARILL